MQEKPKLSVIVPAFKEEKRIAKTMERFKKYFEKERKEKYPYEIVVVIDGSPDDTFGVVKRYENQLPLRIINYKENRGKGYAVRQGMLEAYGEIRLFADADNATDISQVEKVLEGFKEGYQVVIASRKFKGAKIQEKQSLLRSSLGSLGNLVIQVLAVWGVKDTQCGFKAFSKEVVEKIFPKLLVDRWGFDVEILAVARKYGYKIKQVGVAWVNVEGGTVGPSAFVTTLWEVLKIRLWLWIGMYK
jgi:dolichyl-phosphate beta-glucosyltransferase